MYFWSGGHIYHIKNKKMLPPLRYRCLISQFTKAPFLDSPVTLGLPIGVPGLAALETRKCWNSPFFPRRNLGKSSFLLTPVRLRLLFGSSVTVLDCFSSLDVVRFRSGVIPLSCFLRRLGRSC